MSNRFVVRFPDHRGLRKNYSQLEKYIVKQESKANSEQNSLQPLPVGEKSNQSESVSNSLPWMNLKVDTAVAQTSNNSSKSNLLSPLKSPLKSPTKRRDIASSQSKGSRRAQRMQQSIVGQIPVDMESAESKSNFILNQLGVATDRFISSSEGFKDKPYSSDSRLTQESEIDEDAIIGNNKFLERLRGTPLLPKKTNTKIDQIPSQSASSNTDNGLSAWTESEGQSLFYHDGPSQDMEDNEGVVPLSQISSDPNDLGARPTTSFRKSHPDYKYYEDDEEDEDAQ